MSQVRPPLSLRDSVQATIFMPSRGPRRPAQSIAEIVDSSERFSLLRFSDWTICRSRTSGWRAIFGLAGNSGQCATASAASMATSALSNLQLTEPNGGLIRGAGPHKRLQLRTSEHAVG